jgi:hypothetical protein
LIYFETGPVHLMAENPMGGNGCSMNCSSRGSQCPHKHYWMK